MHLTQFLQVKLINLDQLHLPRPVFTPKFKVPCILLALLYKYTTQ